MKINFKIRTFLFARTDKIFRKTMHITSVRSVTLVILINKMFELLFKKYIFKVSRRFDSSQNKEQNRRHGTLALQQIIQAEPVLKCFHSFIDLFRIIINLKKRSAHTSYIELFIKTLYSRPI